MRREGGSYIVLVRIRPVVVVIVIVIVVVGVMGVVVVVVRVVVTVVVVVLVWVGKVGLQISTRVVVRSDLQEGGQQSEGESACSAEVAEPTISQLSEWQRGHSRPCSSLYHSLLHLWQKTTSLSPVRSRWRVSLGRGEEDIVCRWRSWLPRCCC